MAAQADAKAGAIKVDHGMKTQASNNGGNSKFATQFQDDQELMQTKCGTLTDFDQGLDGKIGHPNPNVEEAMEKETSSVELMLEAMRVSPSRTKSSSSMTR